MDNESLQAQAPRLGAMPRNTQSPEDRRPPPTGVRLDPALRAQLESAAARSGRNLSQEIAWRLRESLGGPSSAQELLLGTTTPRYTPSPAASGIVLRDPGEDPPLDTTLRRLLALFERLSPEQRLALLTLLAM
jgi:hypothetical protein